MTKALTSDGNLQYNEIEENNVPTIQQPFKKQLDWRKTETLTQIRQSQTSHLKRILLIQKSHNNEKNKKFTAVFN